LRLFQPSSAARTFGRQLFQKMAEAGADHEMAPDRLDEVEVAAPLKSQADLVERAFVNWPGRTSKDG